jgi:hypothetical protein
VAIVTNRGSETTEGERCDDDARDVRCVTHTVGRASKCDTWTRSRCHTRTIHRHDLAYC